MTDKRGEDGDKETQACGLLKTGASPSRANGGHRISSFSVLLRLLLIVLSSVQLGHGVHRLLLPRQRSDAPG